MRPYHSANQHKHFKKIKYNERAAPLFSTTKEYLTFKVQIIIRIARITHVPHLFSMKQIFLEVNKASLSTQKKERKKIFEFE